MKNYFCVTLAILAIVGFTANQVDARGGGHGGGHHGGGHHNGHHNNGNHHANNHHGNHHHHVHHVHHNGNHRPFTPGWNGHHNGWNNGWNHGYANAWAGAGFGAAATWLGLSALNSGIGYGNGYGAGTTVYTGDTGTPLADQVVGDQQVADGGTQPNTTDVADGNGPNQNVISQHDQASTLATKGEVELPADAKFLSLGVFSVAPKDQTEASAMLHLAVNKDGILRGSYYDLLSNQEHDIEGAIDKTTQRAAWTVAPHGEVVFETSLKELTEETGPLAVFYENGETRQWTLARYEGDDVADDASDTGKAGATEKPTSEKATN